jgi:RNA polymerase sigma-70 factor (ECF subfamily)
MSYAATAEVRGCEDRQEELRLLSSVLSGSTAARKRFVVCYSSVIEAKVRHILRTAGVRASEDDIQDMVSEIWLALLEDDMRPLRRFDPSRQIKVATWIGLLARNKTIDKLRTSRPRKTVAMEQVDPGNEPPSQQPLPTDEVERREYKRLADRALCKLNAEERRFMEAWYVEDRDPEELARLFGIALGTVYSRRFKIQAKLARSVQSMRVTQPIRLRTIH